MDIVKTVEDVVNLDRNEHLFCPRHGSEDSDIFFDEDLLVQEPDYLTKESTEDREKRKKRLKEAESRTDLVLEACTILAFDGEDARPFQEKLKKALAKQLSRCDICVRQYHRSRSKLKSMLEAQYGDDEVLSFMETFDDMNKHRIKEGLDDATQSLLDLPPEQRSIVNAGERGMYALFEALNCLPFLQDEASMQASFDKPFQMCQTKKKIKLPNYPPGMVAFLYSTNEARSAWAHRAFEIVKRPLTTQEFEHSVKPLLEPALNRVHISCLEEDFLSMFWKAMRLILSKCTDKIITGDLRPMDANLWTMSLEHFQINKEHINDLLDSHKILLELSPIVYWDAMGAIQPQAVLDTMFKAPRLDKLMRDSSQDAMRLVETFDFLFPFLKSVKADNLIPPLRSILDHMLDQYQDSRYPQKTRTAAFELGMKVLLSVLDVMREKAVKGPVVSGMLELITKDYLNSILKAVGGVEAKDELRITKTEETALHIIESLLYHDCRALALDRLSILQTKNLDHKLSDVRVKLWKDIMSTVKPGQPLLAAAIVPGVLGLLTLEPLARRQIEAATKPAETWNSALDQRQKITAEVFLEKLQSLSTDNLIDLFQDRHAIPGLFALLFSGAAEIHEAALDLVKTMSGEDSRRDSLMFMLRKYLLTTLSGTNSALRTISKSRAFTPCANMLKLCTDLYSCLCDDTDGLLRSDRQRDSKETEAIETFWQTSWSSLALVFEQTEAWSNLGHDKAMLQDFCRATMDFAEFVFDQYSLLSGSLSGADDDVASVRTRLLQKPRSVFASAIKWLRLRDDYLIIKAVQLTCKMLARFQEAKLDVSQIVLDTIGGVLDGKVKTKLTENQKAEIQRALERCIGRSLKPETAVKQEPPKAASKTGKLDIQAWTAQAAKDRDLYGDKTSVKSSSTTSTIKKEPTASKLPLARPKTVKAPVDARKMDEFKLKRQRDKEEADRRRAEAVAKAKGLGAGSIILGLGDLGKDHTLKGKNVMVSSSESSEDSDDELDEDLFGPRVGKDKKISRPGIDTFGMTLKPEQKRGPTKIQRTQRSFKDMRARLAPDLQHLHRSILKWDFFHEGVYPPGTPEHQYKNVSNVFNDPTTYQKTFEPLLTLEAWQGMVKAREENSSKPYSIKIVGRSNVDSFLELSSAISHQDNRDLQLSEGDIILLSAARSPADASDSPHCLARIYRIKRQKAQLEVVYQLIPGGPMDKHLTLQATIFALKVQSIIPLEREYGALQALQYYDLCNQIVRAKPSPRIPITDKQIGNFQDIWNVNRAQAEAINAALLNEGFSLIQGPPGSGKTKTIVAIVGGLLSDSLGSTTQATRIHKPGQETATANSGAARKLLVCAPSNAAVDELVMRLKSGVKTRHGKHHMLNVVRIGRSEAINQHVLDVTMDELVAKRLGSVGANESTRLQQQQLFKEHEKVSAELKMLYEKRDSNTAKGKEANDLIDSIGSTRRRKQELGAKIDNVKDQERNAGREAELNRKKAQQAVLNDAQVICATLSGSGHDMFQSLNVEFETVIIDEAAQCVEMSSLIPLKYGCVKCIMVGDPKQLPPTVFSKEAAQFQYEQSLFVRMQNNFPKEVYLLDTQYRMHPHISLFPSRTFYDGLLKDGPGMTRLRSQPWHASELLAPYRFFDVRGQHQAAPKGHSLINLAEIDVAIALFSRVRADFGNYDFKGKIGVITPYKSQLRALKERFSSRFGQSIFETIEFNTTDAFQGRESEIIIFSCVRASPAGGIGFLQDIRRMNVGLTRAKSSLWVLGNSESLARGQYWRKLVDDAHARDSYTTGDVLGLLSKPSSAFPAPIRTDASMHDVSSHVSQMTNGKHGPDIKQEKAGDQEAHPKMKRERHAESNGNVKVKQESRESTHDRMEGVTYKFEDRVKKRQSSDAQDEKVSRRKETPKPPNDQDVEMKDADSDSGASTSRNQPPQAKPKLVRPPTNPFIRHKARGR